MMRDWWLDLDHGRITLVATGAGHSARYLLGLAVTAPFGDAEARCEVCSRELCEILSWLSALMPMLAIQEPEGGNTAG